MHYFLHIHSFASFALSFDHDHPSLNEFLKKYVITKESNSYVNYSDILKNKDHLTKYLKELEVVSKKEFDHFTSNVKLAFLINSYNAFTIKLIIDNYPIKSIKDISTFFTNPWEKKFIHLLGEEHHLDDIEHNMIRKWFNEPKIHFALVCASIGCPPLKDTAYTGKNLDSQLEDSAKKFLSDRSKNRFNPANSKIEISSIFKWYGDDFIKKFGSIENFLAPYLSTDKKIIEQINNKQFSIEFLEYDWILNDILLPFKTNP